jgi:uncharacterized protein YjbJ (UPF0337 family)
MADERTDKIKGKAKEMQGKATGDKSREAEGKVEQAKGKAKGKAKDATADMEDRVDESMETLKRDDRA